MSDNVPAVPQMDEAEARVFTDRLKVDAVALFERVEEAHDRGAWRALGYTNFKDYVVAELDMTGRNAFRLLDQARVAGVLTAASDARVTPTARQALILKNDLPSVAAEVAAAVEAGASPTEAVAAAVAARKAPRPPRRPKLAPPAPEPPTDRTEADPEPLDSPPATTVADWLITTAELADDLSRDDIAALVALIGDRLPQPPEVPAMTKKTDDAPTFEEALGIVTVELLRRDRPERLALFRSLAVAADIAVTQPAAPTKKAAAVPAKAKTNGTAVKPADCGHPVGRRIESTCMVCGATVAAGKR